MRRENHRYDVRTIERGSCCNKVFMKSPQQEFPYTWFHPNSEVIPLPPVPAALVSSDGAVHCSNPTALIVTGLTST